MGLLLAWTALAGVSGSCPRMVSSALSDKRNCCMQTISMLTALPSYPAYSWRRPVSTDPWSGFVGLSGYRSGDGKHSNVYDRFLGERKLVSTISG